MNNSQPTTDDVAEWMQQQSLSGELYQDDAVWTIMKKFGKQFTYDNANGNPAIDKKVLDKFKKISGDDIVWSRSGRLWRKRTARDEPGRMQE
ncbi:hypothetical protein ALP8811_02051 [Aliiroseovarius pelagivivens]|uniref:Uncharacterized protein n=1 Tax=Aliiroseovarius pelagivivens TaxID=1639690 RepID=A0A2R8ALZ5_9RHOB|nr:hypothetical protein [Aliiroseovarius pelagivivens]SPF77030.1 hypothetical protein ALP8811_02051 [Aliiroseovarius pelagivivens]